MFVIAFENLLDQERFLFRDFASMLLVLFRSCPLKVKLLKEVARYEARSNASVGEKIPRKASKVNWYNASAFLSILEILYVCSTMHLFEKKFVASTIRALIGGVESKQADQPDHYGQLQIVNLPYCLVSNP